MDDGDILGYVDMKNMVYRSADTGLAELLIDAAAHPDEMFLICFDEMNLPGRNTTLPSSFRCWKRKKIR